jgi:hypothetical protein
MGIKKIILAIILCAVAPLGYAADIKPNISSYSLVPSEDGMMYFSYNLADPDGKFFETLRDAVRGHNKITVKHKVTITPVGDLWGSLAVAEQTHYVSYDILRESFEIGNTPDTINITTQDEGTASHILLSVREVPLVALDQLYSGQEYKISVKVSIDASQRSRWTRWLPLKWFGRDELNVEAYYIAR